MEQVLISDYAVYVLSAWGLAIVILLGLTLSAYLDKRKIEKQLIRRAQRNSLVKQGVTQ